MLPLAGHFACRRENSAPPEAELLSRLYGKDGSVPAFVPGVTLQLPAEGHPDRELLNEVIFDVAEFLMLKLQHSSSIVAYDNHIRKLLRMKRLESDYRRLLQEYAADYDHGLALLAASGFLVSVAMHAHA